MNKRRKNHKDLEVVQEGFANGVAPGFPLSEKEKQKMINKAAKAYARFLEALKCDWQNDPNSADTPMRVAKAYVNDLWAGRYTQMFPSHDHNELHPQLFDGDENTLKLTVYFVL